MIKQLLFTSLLLAPCAQSMAQSIKKADNVTMYSISENGKYACSANEGVVVLWNTEKDNNTTTFDDQYYYCDGVSNDGMMAGSVGPTGYEQPIIFTTGKTIYLPMPEDREWAYGSARGISSDGKFVCGLLSDASVDIMDNTTAIIPVVWEIDGDNITCTILPYAEKDFTGRCPQGYHPLLVSESKNRILGRQIDYSGLGGAIIVWDRTAPGEPWTYTILGEDLQYKDGPDFPEYPDEPKIIDYSDYMTEEEIAAYETAYNNWCNNGYVGNAPKREEYITDETRKAQYLEAVEEYNKAAEEYNNKVNEFYNIYYERKSDYSLDLYSFSGSFNGRYVGCPVTKMEFDDYGWPTDVPYPCYYDIDDNCKLTILDDEKYANFGLSGRISDNGDLAVSKPARATMFDARNSYVITAGDNKIVNVYEYLGKTNEGKVNRQTFADGGLEFSWTGYDMETYEQVEVKDSILVGTLLLSADGKNAAGFTTDPSTFTITSWALNSFTTTGINTAKVSKAEAVLRSNIIEDGVIEFVADVENAALFDLSGVALYSGKPQGSSMAAPAQEGIYILKAKLKNGAVRTDKIVVR